eukprot:1551916-Amphidinium_carterae.1
MAVSACLACLPSLVVAHCMSNALHAPWRRMAVMEHANRLVSPSTWLKTLARNHYPPHLPLRIPKTSTEAEIIPHDRYK